MHHNVKRTIPICWMYHNMKGALWIKTIVNHGIMVALHKEYWSSDCSSNCQRKLGCMCVLIPHVPSVFELAISLSSPVKPPSLLKRTESHMNLCDKCKKNNWYVDILRQYLYLSITEVLRTMKLLNIQCYDCAISN